MESAAAASAWVSRRAARSRLIATARRTLVSSSAASGRSRSANTLPELTSIDSPLLLRLRISHLIIGQCRLETAPDEFHVGLRGAHIPVPGLYLNSGMRGSVSVAPRRRDTIT